MRAPSSVNTGRAITSQKTLHCHGITENLDHIISVSFSSLNKSLAKEQKLIVLSNAYNQLLHILSALQGKRYYKYWRLKP